MRPMMFARFPNLVKQERSGDIGSAVKVIGQAAFFAPRGSNQGSQFSLEQNLLARLGTQKHD